MHVTALRKGGLTGGEGHLQTVLYITGKAKLGKGRQEESRARERKILNTQTSATHVHCGVGSKYIAP